MEHGQNDWQNIQGVIRSSFLKLNDVIQVQSTQLSHLGDVVDELRQENAELRASIRANSLTLRASSDSGQRLSQLSEAIADVRERVSTRPSKRSVVAALQRKVDAADLAALNDSMALLSQEQDRLKAQYSALASALDAKPDAEAVNDVL
ncbi:hypothetical protein KIPB_011898, partial [Kipferlia bialata]|eukprot:g11898.t1